MRSIDADELKHNMIFECCTECDCCTHVRYEGGNHFCGLIEEAPTVEQNWKFYFDHGYKQAERDLERPHGKWIKLPRYEGDTQPDFKCDNCGYEITYFSEDSFCARCGADMRGGAEE